MNEIEEIQSDSAQNLDATKGKIQELLKIAQIKRVIVVDDEWGGALGLEPILGELSVREAREESFSFVAIPELAGINFEVPNEVWEPLFRTAWESMAAARRAEVFQHLGITQEESGAGHILRELFTGTPIHFLSQQEWVDREKDLITTASTQRTLFLFDQDMTKDEGSADQGIRTIAGLLRSGSLPDGEVFLALFSNVIIGNREYEILEKLAIDYSITAHKNKFAVVSKEHLRNDPELIAARLKRVIISPICESLKTTLFSAVSNAADEAKRKIDELNVYDFEQIVFQSSFVEGVWEPDTLLRLFGLYYREAARQLAQGDPNLREMAAKVRAVIAVQYEPDDRPKSRAADLQRLELYESAEYLIDHKLPIDLGDIFVKTDGGSHWILLAQPCALVVRGASGKRDLAGETVTLAKIVYKPKEEAMGDAYLELPFFSKDETKKAYVNLKSREQVETCILDLCVYSEIGEASVQIGMNCPQGVIPAWEKRYADIQKQAKSIVDKFRDLKAQVTGPRPAEVLKILKGTLTSSLSRIVRGEIKESPGRVSYPIKRIGRLKQPRAGSLLRDFADYGSRDAFDHDLTKTVDRQASSLELMPGS
ncbi:MAG TPA: hypothetical protein VJ505_03970 [Holophagaceae bacterium]|nr:hypothetical protein [Holophagaceae bacterium]